MDKKAKDVVREIASDTGDTVEKETIRSKAWVKRIKKGGSKKVT